MASRQGKPYQTLIHELLEKAARGRLDLELVGTTSSRKPRNLSAAQK